MKQGEGFTCNPLVFSELCANRRVVKAKNENSLSACASARAYARETEEGKRAVAKACEKGERFSQKVHLFEVKVVGFSSAVVRK